MGWAGFMCSSFFTARPDVAHERQEVTLLMKGCYMLKTRGSVRFFYPTKYEWSRQRCCHLCMRTQRKSSFTERKHMSHLNKWRVFLDKWSVVFVIRLGR